MFSHTVSSSVYDNTRCIFTIHVLRNGGAFFLCQSQKTTAYALQRVILERQARFRDVGGFIRLVAAAFRADLR